MTQARFAHGLTGVFLIAFAGFAALLLLLGVLIAVSAERIVETQQQGSPLAYYVAGAAMAVIALLMLQRSLRHAGAVARIDVGGDGTWTLYTRFGRTLGRVGADQSRRLELSCESVILMSSAVPRRQELSSGVLEAGGRRWKLATSGPETYDRALGALGYRARAPRPGETLTV